MRERGERERENLSGGVLQTNWCNWPMKDLRSQVGSKTLGMPTEQANRICHLLGHQLIVMSSILMYIHQKACLFQC